MTATVTLPPTYTGPIPVAVSKSVTATLNACSAVALAFTTNPVNFSRTEQFTNTNSVAFTAADTAPPNSCNFSINYSSSIVPASTWVTYNSFSRLF